MQNNDSTERRDRDLQELEHITATATNVIRNAILGAVLKELRGSAACEYVWERLEEHYKELRCGGFSIVDKLHHKNMKARIFPPGWEHGAFNLAYEYGGLMVDPESGRPILGPVDLDEDDSDETEEGREPIGTPAEMFLAVEDALEGGDLSSPGTCVFFRNRIPRELKYPLNVMDTECHFDRVLLADDRALEKLVRHDFMMGIVGGLTVAWRTDPDSELRLVRYDDSKLQEMSGQPLLIGAASPPLFDEVMKDLREGWRVPRRRRHDGGITLELLPSRDTRDRSDLFEPKRPTYEEVEAWYSEQLGVLDRHW